MIKPEVKIMNEENDDQWVYDWVVDESTWNGWRIFPE
jgi:hypothetical protein